MSDTIDNNVAALASDSHNLGEFKNVYEAMKAYPNGGVEGDYITILGVQHFWNINRMSWGILKNKEDNLIQMVEDMIANFEKNGYLFVGIATPETKPTNILNAFYIAVIPGEYENFSVILEPNKVYVLKNTEAGWVAIDTGIINQPLVEITKELGDSEEKVICQKTITNLFSEGYLFVGMAAPDTIPIEAKGKVFYLASDKGTYKGFGDITLDGSVLYIFKLVNDIWETEKTGVLIDPELAVSNAEKIANEAKQLAEESKNMAEIADQNASSALMKSDAANKTADLSLSKSSTNEVLVKAANEKVDDLSKGVTDSMQKSTEALGLAKNAVKTSDRGIPGGIPILDENGKIPQSQLPLTKTELVDSYESDAMDKAPTAAALHRLYLYHEDDIVATKNLLNAVLDMVSSSTELGVSPTQINVTSEAQSVKLQIICNGEWTVNNVPQGITITPLRGTGNGVITIDFSANDSTEQDVIGSFAVSNSYGKEKVINYTQYSASTRYVYELSVEPSSIDVGAIAGNGHFDVVSTKTPYINNTPAGEVESVPYALTIPEGMNWMRIVKSRSTEQYEYDENILEASRSTIMTIKQEGVNGKTVEVPFNQAKATTHTEFVFKIVPANADITDDGAGGIYPAKITSTKTVTINGKSETTDIPFAISYEGGATSVWTVFNKEAGTITIPINNNELARTGAIVFTQEGIANVLRVNISQAAATIGWNYTFEITPSELRFGNAASSKNYEVVKCVKKKTINGNEVGDEVQVSWEVSINSDIFTLNKETNSVSAPENTGELRNAELLFNRPELGADDRKVINIVQEAGVVTWAYTLEASVNPTSIAALNGSTVLSVTSTKQKYINGIAVGDPLPVEWHGTSSNGYLSGQDVSGTSWVMQENRTESARVESLIINQLEEGGKSKTLNVTQLAGTVTWDYSFGVSPTSLSFNYSGGTQSVSVTSTKQKKINGINSGSPISVGYSSSTSGTGFSSAGTSISASQNNTLSGRSGTATFTQSESGKTTSVSLSQAAGVEGWNYTFGVSPTSLSFEATGGTKSVSVTSYRRQTINGSETGVQENVGYSTSVSGSGFSSSSTSVTASENTNTSSRSGSITFTQNDSGKSVEIILSQNAASITYERYLTPNYGTIGTSVTLRAFAKKYINGKYISESEISWYLLTQNGGYDPVTSATYSKSTSSGSLVVGVSRSGNTISSSKVSGPSSSIYGVELKITVDGDRYSPKQFTLSNPS